MKIEVGKRYVTRDGQVTHALLDGKANGYGSYWSVCVLKGTLRADAAPAWTRYGKFRADGREHPCDLVSEYVEPNTTIRDGVPLGVAVPLNAYEQAANDALAEVRRAKDMWPGNFNSAHEGYAVLLEEVDELWGHVKTNQKRRDLGAMRKEAIQVAAMALRFAAECCDEVTGRK